MLSKQTHSDAQRPVPKGLRPRFNYQEGLSAAVNEPQRDRLALFVDKRIGKCTIATEWVLARPSHPQAILIVAPNSSLPDWIRNLQSDGQKAILLEGSEQQRYDEACAWWNLSKEPIFFITNPQGLFHAARKGNEKCPECEKEGFPIYKCGMCGGSGKLRSKKKPEPTAIAMMDWDAVIWDESIELKNPKAQITQIAHRAFKQTPCKAVLTGEPKPESIFDIFEQMVWCFNSFMGHTNFWNWRNEHFLQDGHTWNPRLGSLRKIKEAIQARCLFLTRRAAGVEEAKTRRIILCNLPQKFADIYRHCEKNFELPPGIERPKTRTKFIIVMRNWLSSLAGGCRPGYLSDHKMSVLMRIILDELNGEQFMVIFRFNSELDRAAHLLRKFSIAHSELRGGMTTAERDQVADRLRRKKIQGVLCQIKAVKYGADLSMINHLIRYSLPHSYNEISQSQDRVVHTQKKDLIRITDIVTKNTVDEDIILATRGKTRSSRSFMETCTDAMEKRRRR